MSQDFDARNSPPRILLLGKGGQVGWELQRALAPLGALIALDFDSTGLCGDFTDLQGLAQTVRAVKPHVIVNAAAHTAVDKAESEPGLARTINALAPGVLAAEAAGIGALLVHYSTDYVFDGSGDVAWREDDAVAPLSVYGKTKLEGEQLIRRERLPAPRVPHQLGVCRTWRQFRQDNAATGRGARKTECHK